MLAGSKYRYANPHGLPSLIGVRDGENINATWSHTMSNTPGADVRQSRTLPSLNRFTPDGINALAAVGLILLDAINDARLVVNASLPPNRRESARILVEWLYVLQDALHGSDEPLPAVLASFLSVAERSVCRG
ncbi:hypothetical protein [Accumulibacter sp.]|uniref:hypothetical protein n=1 Tax=Accumulibacter sp. TaxID=2053492 RepID=UPI002608257C|nr:hypothetical protein [Accumulibacter sp.]